MPTYIEKARIELCLERACSRVFTSMPDLPRKNHLMSDRDGRPYFLLTPFLLCHVARILVWLTRRFVFSPTEDFNSLPRQSAPTRQPSGVHNAEPRKETNRGRPIMRRRAHPKVRTGCSTCKASFGSFPGHALVHLLIAIESTR